MEDFCGKVCGEEIKIAKFAQLLNRMWAITCKMYKTVLNL